MLNDLFTILNDWLSASLLISVMASFLWGILSIILSPCHLSSIPLIVGYISSQGNISGRRTFNISLVFSVGILITIALIGFITASLGRLMGDIGIWGNYIVALIFFIIGLYLLDLISLPGTGMQMKGTSQKGLLAALILGLIFGIALGPCTFAYMAPVLGVVFQTSQSNLIASLLILFAFGIGHCFVITLAGSLTNRVQQYLNWSEDNKAIKWIKKSCGILVILGGLYLLIK